MIIRWWKPFPSFGSESVIKRNIGFTCIDKYYQLGKALPKGQHSGWLLRRDGHWSRNRSMGHFFELITLKDLILKGLHGVLKRTLGLKKLSRQIFSIMLLVKVFTDHIQKIKIFCWGIFKLLQLFQSVGVGGSRGYLQNMHWPIFD